MGALFIDDTDLYTWRENILDPGDLWCQAQLELEHWSCLLNATGGALKPDNVSGTSLIMSARMANEHMLKWSLVKC